MPFKPVKARLKITGKAKKPCDEESKPAREAKTRKTGSGVWPGSLRGWGPITRELD